ncbi:MAG: hypothetical protein COX19_05635 [Desulfobacterales bacterium CG23_combo_of_CG06-09_8_20_14_all_51_8]|nr:MAG: hypothetical protein COX19_05635 [Desulfobacterales bacterium CG23_combo_of_CG06-09_8_20_14_all_51_8]
MRSDPHGMCTKNLFEDDTSIVETTFFPDAYHLFYNVLDYGRPYLISGKVEENWGAITLTVDGIRSLMAQLMLLTFCRSKDQGI